jgi:antitoxin YefM
MSTVYRLKASELDSNFLEKIKAIFGDKEIEISVSECDETEYLLKSEVNKNKLLKAIENVKDRQNLVEVDLQDLQ